MTGKKYKSAKKKDLRFQICVCSILGIISLLFLYPIYYQFIASVSDPLRIAANPLMIVPKGFTLEVYRQLFRFKSVWVGYINSIINLVLYVAATLVTTMLTAYAMSRPIIGKKFFTVFFMIPMFLQGGMIPTFLTISGFGLYNSRFALIVPFIMIIWNMLMARSFLQQNISESLYEAAIIDGASEIKFFVFCVLPLSKSIMAVLMLYYGATNWNSYFNEMLYLKDRELFTLQLVLREVLIMNQFVTEGGADISAGVMAWQESIKYAVTVVSILPLLIIFPFVQKYFVKGVMIGSLKE